MSEKIDIAAVVALLAKADNILILCHKNPDGDTLGSAGALFWALKAQDKVAAVLCADGIHARYSYMQMQEFHDQFEPEFVVAVDIAGVQLFGDTAQKWGDRVDLCIDHHGSNSGYADMLLLDASAAATCEIMYEVILAMGVEIDKRIAECLYTGVSTDTGCFKFANTTARTHTVAAKLMELGADVRMLNELLFENQSPARLAIEQQALASLEYHFDGQCALICLTRDQIDSTGVEDSDLEGITSLPRSIEGVCIGITMRQQVSGSYKISVRTKVGMDATKVVVPLGGGGHRQAAGCEILGGIEYAKAAILAEAEKVLRAGDEPEEKQAEEETE